MTDRVAVQQRPELEKMAVSVSRFTTKNMKLIKLIGAVICGVALQAGPAFAGDKTCCQKAAAEGKDCTHKCCVAAHKNGKSCEKCNPGKEDLKLKRQEKKSNKAVEKKSSES